MQSKPLHERVLSVLSVKWYHFCFGFFIGVLFFIAVLIVFSDPRAVETRGMDANDMMFIPSSSIVTDPINGCQYIFYKSHMTPRLSKSGMQICVNLSGPVDNAVKTD